MIAAEEGARVKSSINFSNAWGVEYVDKDSGLIVDEDDMREWDPEDRRAGARCIAVPLAELPAASPVATDPVSQAITTAKSFMAMVHTWDAIASGEIKGVRSRMRLHLKLSEEYPISLRGFNDAETKQAYLQRLGMDPAKILEVLEQDADYVLHTTSPQGCVFDLVTHNVMDGRAMPEGKKVGHMRYHEDELNLTHDLTYLTTRCDDTLLGGSTGAQSGVHHH